MTGEILIDTLTRLEGHGRIHVFLDDDGEAPWVARNDAPDFHVI